VVATDETFERRGSQVISSIGSIPVPIEGIPMKGELFDFVDPDLGRLAGFPRVFSTGNVATGKGNIVASRKHAKAVAAAIIEAFLGLPDAGHAGEEALLAPVREAAAEAARALGREVTRQPPLASEALAALRGRAFERQRAVGYDGRFEAWLQRVTPPDME
jgi:hypothetical protein